MKDDAITLEEKRLEEINNLDDYNMIHERHRIFPQVFEDRNHKKIIDLSAGVGVVAKNIKEQYQKKHDGVEIYCNDLSPKCLSLLKENGYHTFTFNLDDEESQFPISSNSFDAVITLATIEHLIHIDHFIDEISRILKDDGNLYISAPNYSGILYLLRFLWTGKTFHDPMIPSEKYEFYAHVRYFTYQTLIDVIELHGFVIDSVYLGIPQESTKYINLKKKAPLKAFIFRNGMSMMYKFFSPRWASEPVLCFRIEEKSTNPSKPRKVIL